MQESYINPATTTTIIMPVTGWFQQMTRIFTVNRVGLRIRFRTYPLTTARCIGIDLNKLNAVLYLTQQLNIFPRPKNDQDRYGLRFNF